jgi:hypothetical protein
MKNTYLNINIFGKLISELCEDDCRVSSFYLLTKDKKIPLNIHVNEKYGHIFTTEFKESKKFDNVNSKEAQEYILNLIRKQGYEISEF